MTCRSTSPYRRRTEIVPSADALTRRSTGPDSLRGDVRLIVFPPRRRHQEDPRQGSADRRRRRRRPERDPHGAARGRRERRGRAQRDRSHPRAGRRRQAQPGARPGSANRQDRQQRAHGAAGRRDAEDHLRQPAADRGADGRPAGLGQDHQRGEVGPVVQEPGPPAADGRCRPAAPRGRRAAAHPRSADRRAGVQRAGRPGQHRRGAVSKRLAGSAATC